MEPQDLATTLHRLIRDYPAGTHVHGIAKDLIEVDRTCRERRSAILKYPRLAAALTRPPLNYHKPSQWNGWIPPVLTGRWSGEDILRSPSGRGNQLGNRGRGEMVNDSPRRDALIILVREAWELEHWQAPPCLP